MKQKREPQGDLVETLRRFSYSKWIGGAMVIRRIGQMELISEIGKWEVYSGSGHDYKDSSSPEATFCEDFLCLYARKIPVSARGSSLVDLIAK